MRVPVVLIADDIGTWVNAQAMALRHCGIHVVEACSFTEANQSAKEAIVDLALIDLRLVDDSDEWDTSGISVCNELPSETIRVLVTGHAATAREVMGWIQKKNVHYVLEKMMSAASRREEVRRLLKNSDNKHHLANFGLRIAFAGRTEVTTLSGNGADPHWMELAKYVEPARATADEVSYLFHRLLPEELDFAEMHPVRGGASGAGVVRATVQYKETLLKEHVFIKFGVRRVVDREATNFRKFVEPFATRGFAPRRWSATSRNLSAVAYWYVQPERPIKLPSFAEYVTRESYLPSDGPNIITSIFSEICKPWFEAYRAQCRNQRGAASQASASLRRYFMERLWPSRSSSETLEKIARTAEAIKFISGVTFDGKGMVMAQFGTGKITTRDVATVVREENRDDRWPRAALDCVTHGDLHARNIFIVLNEPWIIDYADCGWGHPFRDFVALEVSLRFGVLYDYSSPVEIWTLERELAMPELIDYGKIPEGQPILRKAAELTSAIREKASQLSDCVADWQRQYAVACMFQLLKLAGMRKRISGLEDDGRAEHRRLLAFLAAGAVAEALRL